MDMFTLDESYDPDLSSKKLWAEVPEAIRKQVEQHVSANLPAEVLAKLRDLHACRERLSDSELASYCSLGGDWDSCYIGVLAAISEHRDS
jgi:hypothetical protein